MLTSVESDHQDFYPDYNSIRDAFVLFVLSLPEKGELIYCHDDDGAREVAQLAANRRPDIVMVPYGETADGPWKLHYGNAEAGVNLFHVDAYNQEFRLAIPGRHLALDAVAALALVSRLKNTHNREDISALAASLAGFRGSRRRSEIIGERSGILVMDDYAHHPTAIVATLRGLKSFHPDRRLVVDFMPHTYSRTSALFNDFTRAFTDADVLILHDIYASAREHYKGSVSGKDLFVETKLIRGDKLTLYYENLDEAGKRYRLLFVQVICLLRSAPVTTGRWAIG